MSAAAVGGDRPPRALDPESGSQDAAAEDRCTSRPSGTQAGGRWKRNTAPDRTAFPAAPCPHPVPRRNRPSDHPGQLLTRKKNAKIES